MRVRGRVAVASAAVLLAALAAPAVRAATDGDAADGTYEVFVQKDVLIPMSDGAQLDADIYLPAKNGVPVADEFPTLLVQTPYNKQQQNPANTFLVQHGFVDVVVDVRGTGGSEGVFDQTFSERSQEDGVDLVAWASNQPWSNGRVGLHGESYYAINQLLTAARVGATKDQSDPQNIHRDAYAALKAMFPVVPTGDNYRTNFPGGYLTSLFVFSLLYASDGATPPGYTGSDPLQAARTVGARPASVLLQTENSAGLLAGDDHSYDGPGYAAISPLAQIDHITIPTFLAGGWYDALSQRDAPMLFHELQARGVPAKLLMGPWYHVTAGGGLPADGVPTLDQLQLHWFNHWLAPERGDNDIMSFGPVMFDRLGNGHYEQATTWPVPRISYTRNYLSTGTLGAQTWTGSDTLPWQPASGVCTRSTYIGTFGLAPSTPCETNDAVNDATGLTYDMPITDTDGIDLTGPMSAHLWVETSRNDAFVTLHLEDVAPDGTASELTSGWDSLVFRAIDEDKSIKDDDGDYVMPYHPYTKASVQDATPSTPYEWWIEIRPVAAHLAAGHTLRLSIQTADAVRFLPTAPRLADTAGSVLTVLHDAEHPSWIVLPKTSTSPHN